MPEADFARLPAIVCVAAAGCGDGAGLETTAQTSSAEHGDCRGESEAFHTSGSIDTMTRSALALK